jgi:hypothetical protein
MKKQYDVPADGVGLDPPPYIKMTLGQLVILAADEPTAANRRAFYERLYFSKVGIRTENPSGTIQPGTRITKPGEQMAIPCAQGRDGKSYLVVGCDILAVWAAFPNDLFIELEARVVLEIAKRNGLGVIVQNLLDDKQRAAVVPEEDVSDLLSGKYAKGVVVPPGHKVVVIYPTPNPSFHRCESGFWIVQLGSGKDLCEIVPRVRELASQNQQANVLWIIPPIILESSSVLDTVVSSLDSIAQDTQAVLRHGAVVPYATDRHLAAMKRLKDIGLAVQYSGANGECFVEIHAPDGTITVAYAGGEFTG